MSAYRTTASAADQLLAARIPLLEVASTAANNVVPSVTAHVAQQDVVVTRQGADCVVAEHFGVNEVRLADAAAGAGGHDALAVEFNDCTDDVEVEEREGAVGRDPGGLLRVACIDNAGGLLGKDDSGVQKSDVGGRGYLIRHACLSSTLAWFAVR